MKSLEERKKEREVRAARERQYAERSALSNRQPAAPRGEREPGTLDDDEGSGTGSPVEGGAPSEASAGQKSAKPSGAKGDGKAAAWKPNA